MNGSHELIFLIFSSGCRTYISRSTLWITRCGCRGAGSENDTVTYCCKSTLNLLNHHYISTSLYTWFCIEWLIWTKEKNIDVSKNETHWLLCNVLVKKLIIYIQISGSKIFKAFFLFICKLFAKIRDAHIYFIGFDLQHIGNFLCGYIFFRMVLLHLEVKPLQM